MSGNIDNSTSKATNKKQLKKHVRFGFVETRYYQRSIGYITNKPGIKLGSCYEPFEKTKTYFDKHDPFTCVDCIMKEEHNNATSNEKESKSKAEKLNKFYNIHGEANHMIKRCSRNFRFDILLESGICVQCLMKALIIQFNFLEFLYKNIINEHNSKWSSLGQTTDCISEKENIQILNKNNIQVQQVVISSDEELKRMDNKEDKTSTSCHICINKERSRK